MNPLQLIFPVAVATVFIGLSSLIPEPGRRNFSALMIAGASSTYLSGGFGPWEFAFAALLTFVAYKGLRSYRVIGIGWLLHTGWDILHHLYGHPIIPFFATSSLGCAICDPVIAAWCLMGGRSIMRPAPPSSTPSSIR